MTKKRLPGTPFQQGKKSFKRAIIEHVNEYSKEVISIKKDMRKEAGKIIDAEIKSRFSLMEFCLREIRLFNELLVEKDIATQDEISKKRARIKREYEK